jgi:hypothetical protein
VLLVAVVVVVVVAIKARLSVRVRPEVVVRPQLAPTKDNRVPTNTLGLMVGVAAAVAADGVAATVVLYLVEIATKEAMLVCMAVAQVQASIQVAALLEVPIQNTTVAVLR